MDVSSGELIAMGYRPATVYKAQRAWRDARQQAKEFQNELVDQTATEALDSASSDENVEETMDDSESLRAELENLHIQAERLEAMIDEFDEMAYENEGLKKQVAAMELEARESAHMRQRTKQLEADRQFSQRPCSTCKKPMSGVVSQDAAAALLRDFSHATCLEQQKSNFGKWILGGAAAVYGISKLR